MGPATAKKEEYVRHITNTRRKNGFRWIVDSLLQLPILVTVNLKNIVIIGIRTCITSMVLLVFASAFAQVWRAFHRALAIDIAYQSSTQMKGGEPRQTGFRSRGSLIRSGGSLSSDDLRRRLNELRSTKSGGPVRRSLNGESQYGK